jgi:nitrogen fixation negative regulator NifL
VTAVSGGGPAYVFLLIECLARAGVEAGLPEALALRIARETVAGAGELVHRSSEPAARLRENVTSPGGTTLEALKVLMAEEELLDGMRETFNGAIHRLQGPVNLISAALRMLERRLGDSAEGDPVLSAMREASQAGMDALESLSGSIPQRQTGSCVPVNVNQLIREVVSLMTDRLLAQGIVVDWQPALRLPWVMGAEGRLRSMIKQLLDNAIEAMSQNQDNPRTLSIVTRVQGQRVVRLEIADSGPGIAPELALKVFEPFFSTKPPHKAGRGMGLAMVQEAVTEHAGTVHIDRGYRQGCRIVVELPFSAS